MPTEGPLLLAASAPQPSNPHSFFIDTVYAKVNFINQPKLA